MTALFLCMCDIIYFHPMFTQRFCPLWYRTSHQDVGCDMDALLIDCAVGDVCFPLCDTGLTTSIASSRRIGGKHGNGGVDCWYDKIFN